MTVPLLPASTMADKPSRALVLYGDGLAQFVDQTHLHLHSLASRANCGFLSLPLGPPSESEAERVLREFAQILDASETPLKLGGPIATAEPCHLSYAIPSLSQRFMGMKVALFTNNIGLKKFCHQLGVSLINSDWFCQSDPSCLGHSANRSAQELLKLLGFEEGKVLETSQFDLLIVHVGAGERVVGSTDNANAHDLRFLNSLVGSILQADEPRENISLRLHLSLIMSYGSIYSPRDLNFSSDDERDPIFSKIFPRQSYTMKGEQPRDDVKHHSPMLMAQWQHAVTRRDAVKTFSFKDIQENGGNLVIPADRFIHEVAFKLWKAPKYGA